MVVEIIALIVIVGVIYGYLKHGKEDKTALLKEGVLIGGIVALIIAGLIAISGIESMTYFVGSTISIALSVVFLTVLFIIGTFIGDWLEINLKPT